jgi:hypothetical protein
MFMKLARVECRGAVFSKLYFEASMKASTSSSTWSKFYKTFYDCNLQMLGIS